jgi:hypothetical protein
VAKQTITEETTLSETAVEDKVMKNKEDGVNPNAPGQPLSVAEQIRMKRGELTLLRAKMTEAKKIHEARLIKMEDLRKSLQKMAQETISNEYERLTADEHVMMAALAGLESLQNSKVSPNI